MAVPERRVPGWVLVVALVVVGLLVAIPIVLLRPTPRLGPPVLLILAEDAITSSSSFAVEADFGPHCSKWRWDAGRGHLTVEADQALAGAEGLVLQRFLPGTSNFATTGGDFLRATVRVNGSAWEVRSPVDARVLLTLVPSGERVAVGGATYGPGESWTMSFAYDANTPNGTARITEDLRFENRGIVEPRIVPVQACA